MLQVKRQCPPDRVEPGSGHVPQVGATHVHRFGRPVNESGGADLERQLLEILVEELADREGAFTHEIRVSIEVLREDPAGRLRGPRKRLGRGSGHLGQTLGVLGDGSQ